MYLIDLSEDEDVRLLEKHDLIFLKTINMAIFAMNNDIETFSVANLCSR